MEYLKGYDLGYWAGVIALVLFIGQIWVKGWIDQSIKRRHEIKMKSALIAELMAEWASMPQDRKKLRQLTNEAFLWLPADLAEELSRMLGHDENARSYREFLILFRKHIQGKRDKLDTNKIITWSFTKHENEQAKKE